MNRFDNLAYARVSSSVSEGEIELDALLKEACKGDESAQDVVAHELYPLLVLEASQYCDEPDVAEDVAERLIEEIREGNIEPCAGKCTTLAKVLRLAGKTARRRARSARAD